MGEVPRGGCRVIGLLVGGQKVSGRTAASLHIQQQCASPFPTSPHPVLYAAAQHQSFQFTHLPLVSQPRVRPAPRVAFKCQLLPPCCEKEGLSERTAPHPRPSRTTPPAAGGRIRSVVHVYTMVVLEEQNAEADAARVAGNDLFRQQKYPGMARCQTVRFW